MRFHGNSDYINACFIDVSVLHVLLYIVLVIVYNVQGYHKRKAFLVGPGPMQSTVNDFWTMVWEKSSYVIVMLGQLEENGEVS